MGWPCKGDEYVKIPQAGSFSRRVRLAEFTGCIEEGPLAVDTISNAVISYRVRLNSPPLHARLEHLLLLGTTRSHRHSVRVVVRCLTRYLMHRRTRDTLGLRYRAILMRQQQSLETNDFFSQLRDGSSECVILCAKDLDLLLQVC